MIIHQVSNSLHCICIFHESVVKVSRILEFYDSSMVDLLQQQFILVWNRAVVVWGVILGPNWIPHPMNSKSRITIFVKIQRLLLYLKIFGPPAIAIWIIMPFNLVEASRRQAHLLRYMMLTVQDAQPRSLKI